MRKDELYHYGVKGMKWDPKRPHSRKRNDNGKTGEVERRGDGLDASTPVGGIYRRVPGKKRLHKKVTASPISGKLFKIRRKP